MDWFKYLYESQATAYPANMEVFLMKRVLISLAVVVLVLAYVSAFAGDPAKSTAKETPKNVTLTGEIVDMGCYLSEGAKGAEHKGCASMCINNGMPMGLLTSDGKLYLLTLSHDNADPYNAAKKLAAQQVTITGPVDERNGIKSVTVTDIKEVSTGKTQKQG
jgi:hypothetical protein